MEQLYKRITIDGDVNRLPKEDDIYFAHSKTSGRLTEYSFHNNKETWIENIDWYLQPISTPEVIVGVTEEEIRKEAFRTNDWASAVYRDGFEKGAKYALSQLKTVNLKEELVKFARYVCNVNPEYNAEQYLSARKEGEDS